MLNWRATLSGAVLWVGCGAWLALAACSSGSGKSSKDAQSGPADTQGLADLAGSDGADGTAAGDSTDGSDGSAGTDGVAGSDGTDGSAGDVVDGDTSEPGPDVEGPVNVCGTVTEGGLPIGAACTEHSQCSTGYCYDEALWNEDGTLAHRFCTASCAGCTVVSNCNMWPKAAGGYENKCYPLTSRFIKEHTLDAKSLCLAGCNNDSDCAGLGEYSRCALLSFGLDCNYGVVKVCQPESFVGAETCN